MGKGALYFIDKYKLTCPCCDRYHYDKEFVRKLSEYEDKFGNIADYIISGYRCSVFNGMVGGYPLSHHTMGLAIDVLSVAHPVTMIMMGELRKMGIDLIQTGEFFHIYDWDLVGWLRPSSYYYNSATFWSDRMSTGGDDEQSQ